jgi:hypothetical protein
MKKQTVLVLISLALASVGCAEERTVEDAQRIEAACDNCAASATKEEATLGVQATPLVDDRLKADHLMRQRLQDNQPRPTPWTDDEGGGQNDGNGGGTAPVVGGGGTVSGSVGGSKATPGKEPTTGIPQPSDEDRRMNGQP